MFTKMIEKMNENDNVIWNDLLVTSCDDDDDDDDDGYLYRV